MVPDARQAGERRENVDLLDASPGRRRVARRADAPGQPLHAGLRDFDLFYHAGSSSPTLRRPRAVLPRRSTPYRGRCTDPLTGEEGAQFVKPVVRIINWFYQLFRTIIS